jgi:hypothetical protein
MMDLKCKIIKYQYIIIYISSILQINILSNLNLKEIIIDQKTFSEKLH